MVKRGAFMIQTRGLEAQVNLHRQELISQARSARSRRSGVSKHQNSATQRSAAGLPVTGGRAVRRAVAPRFGAWLIDFGTRLGGATVRTSN
jgi:hypothetical protein